MFRFVSLLTTILACTQYALCSNLHGALYAPSATASIISGQYGNGHGALANPVVSRNIAVPAASVISSHSSAIVHPNSAIGHQQYISAPLTHQIYSSPLVSGGLYGQNGLHANSYAIQRSYTAPLAASGYSKHTVPIVASAYPAPRVQAHVGYNGHLSAW